MALRSCLSCCRSALAYVVLLVAALYLLMPWQPAVSMGLDYAWGLVLNVVHEQEMQFGRDVVFNYGPWGFVEQALYYPATRKLVLVFNALLIVLWTLSMWLAAGPVLVVLCVTFGFVVRFTILG